MLHAPAKHSDYRHHLHEGATRCHRTGWIALASSQITCARCARRLDADVARAPGKARAGTLDWKWIVARLAARRYRPHGGGRLTSAG